MSKSTNPLRTLTSDTTSSTAGLTVVSFRVDETGKALAMSAGSNDNKLLSYFQVETVAVSFTQEIVDAGEVDFVTGDNLDDAPLGVTVDDTLFNIAPLASAETDARAGIRFVVDTVGFTTRLLVLTLDVKSGHTHSWFLA